jgi:DNA repair exonuclease SbcCD ATPase subunit
MKEIVLVSLELGGFRSFKNNTVIEFSQTAGLKLISGINLLEPGLGANGAGKSTIFDAICYCNYGTSVKGLKAADLISYGAKKVTVKAHYEIEGEAVTITRTGSPERIYIQNNEHAEQHQVEQGDIDRVLGLSKPRFLNSVIFGQAVPFFLDLSIPQRGELLDEVLDQGFWFNAADTAATKYNVQLEAIAKLDTARARQEGALQGITETDDLEQRETDWANENARAVEGLLLDVERTETALTASKLERTTLQQQTADNDVDTLNNIVNRNNEKLEGMRTNLALKNQELARLRTDAAFYAENTECPSCGSPITEETMLIHLEEAASKEDGLCAEIDTLRADGIAFKERTDKDATDWRNEMNRVSNLDMKIGVLSGSINSMERELIRLTRAAEDTMERVNPYTAQRQNLADKRAEIKNIIAGLDKDREDATALLAQYKFWKEAFKRARLFCVKRVLQQLEAETMNAAAANGLIGWRIRFTTETETKSGTLKPGIQVEVSSPYLEGKIEQRSPGESQRVRLCVSLGLASLIQRYAGVRFTLEAWDEPSNWLSERGIENLLEYLHRRAESTQKSIYVVDHRALVYSGFSEIWQVTKDVDGSSIELLNRTETA